MSHKLKLASDFLPEPEDMLQRFAILAMSGAGKSNTAVRMAEQMFGVIPWVAVDPKGDWWGVRSNRSGKGPGLEVPVFGGLHGDLPLQPTAGSLIAETIAEQRMTCVLDVSEFESKADQLRFLTDFARTLLRKNRDPLMVFAEEADEYLPQRVMAREAQCVGEWSRMVKRGRFRGIFTTLVTQRSASLNKDALTQTDTLIPMRIASPQDRKAIKEWVDLHSTEAGDLLDSLPSLEDGEVWLWSPNKLKLMHRTRFYRRETFDAGETPSLSSGRRVAKLADVDLKAIEERMAETVEQMAANDPSELKKQIAQLQSRVRELEAREPEVVREVEEVFLFPAPLREHIEKMLQSAEKALTGLATDFEQEVDHFMDNLSSNFDLSLEMIDDKAYAERRDDSSMNHGASIPSPQTKPQSQKPAPPPPRPESNTNSDGMNHAVTGAALKMLQTLVQRSPMKLTRSQLATLSGYSIKSSTIPNNLTKLRNAGAIVENADKTFEPSEEGFRIVGTPPPAPSPGELRNTWRSVLPGAAGTFFDVLVQYHPQKIDRQTLADQAGYSIQSSTIPNNLTVLRRNGLLAEENGMLGLVEWLFQ